MADEFDSIVIGAGPAGETCSAELAAAGQRVAVVERERVAGECSYWACMPSKALLRGGEVAAAARRVPGPVLAQDRDLDARAAIMWRDKVVNHWDDSEHAKRLTDQGIELIRGDALIAGQSVTVEGRELRAPNIIVATGSRSLAPPIDGLDQLSYWTNREATAVRELPNRLLILGGGPIGVELAQAFGRFGVSVALIESGTRILPSEDDAASAALAPVLQDDGVEVYCGAEVTRAHGGESEKRVVLAGGIELRGDKLLVVTGRQPNSNGLGLEDSPVKIDDGAIQVDDRMRAADGIWAIGDVNGRDLTTHSAKYQARVAAANILGRETHADLSAVPRAIFTDPQLCAVGKTASEASGEGTNVVTGRADISELAASSLQREDWRNAHDEFLKLIADADTRTVIGALGIGPRAVDWMGQATLAVRAKLTIDLLAEVIQPFPAMSEVFTKAAIDLQSQLG